ncbi:MAG: hypothetical protein LBM23_08830 [Propionibacteriaceae bacterium]|jgi:hypothetical protein|nr:hypothetical protein [Propionibacteriaceae bacterium]
MATMRISEEKILCSDAQQMAERGQRTTLIGGAAREGIAVVVPIDEWRSLQDRRLGSLKGRGKVTFAEDWSMTIEELIGTASSTGRRSPMASPS